MFDTLVHVIKSIKNKDDKKEMHLLCNDATPISVWIIAYT